MGLWVGVIARCNPITGKTDRDLIYTTQDQETTLITAIHIEKHRIIAGFPSGVVSVINGVNQQRGNSISTFRETLDGPVLAFELIRNGSILVAGGLNGQLNVYSFQHMKRLATISHEMKSKFNACLTLII